MRTPQDRLTLLSTFVRIAERGSISAAARDLGLSQASASRQLQNLEARLGTTLITRTTHALALTRAGERCLADARTMLAHWDALAEDMAGEDGQIAGVLDVVAPVALGQEMLISASLDFQKRHPKLRINWSLDDTPIRFAERGCDIWLRVGPVQEDGLIVRELCRIERFIVAAPSVLAGRKISTPADLSPLPAAVLAPYEGAQISLASGDSVEAIPSPNVVLETNNIFALRKAVQAGLGYAVLPGWFVADDLAHGQLVDVLPDWRAPSLPFHIAYLPAQRQTARLRAFIDHISDLLPNVLSLT